VTGNPRAGYVLGAVALFAAAVLLVVCGTAYAVWQGSRQAQALASEIRTLCAEQGDVGKVPVTAKSSELGVKLVVDFRAAYAGLGCSPALPPPSPLLLRLAAQYGVKVGH
jgi:hypothetical protein